MSGAPGFADATRRYHAWLAQYMPLQPAGLRAKAGKMRTGRFAFLRGTFYRWGRCLATADAAVRAAPAVLAVGDAHLENYGTWRDAEGRLAWGVNDFDEAAALPCTSDLVRLATGIVLERADGGTRLALRGRDAAEAVLDGYRTGLEGGQPFILEAEHPGLRAAAGRGYDPVADWEALRTKGVPDDPPASVRDLLLTTLPEEAVPTGFRRRDDKGLGSLGRPRWILLATWRGGPVAREAKAAAPSAARMEEAGRLDPIADHRRVAALARRAPDPGFRVAVAGGTAWVVRRLSPEARRIELGCFGDAVGQGTLLTAMGAELANVHAGTGGRPAVLAAAVAALPRGWLHDAARAAAEQVETDQAEFLRDPGVVAEMPPLP